MIEYFTFKHSGESDSYRDEVYLTVVPSVTVAMYYGSAQPENSKFSPKMFFRKETGSETDFSGVASSAAGLSFRASRKLKTRFIVAFLTR